MDEYYIFGGSSSWPHSLVPLRALTHIVKAWGLGPHVFGSRPDLWCRSGTSSNSAYLISCPKAWYLCSMRSVIDLFGRSAESLGPARKWVPDQCVFSLVHFHSFQARPFGLPRAAKLCPNFQKPVFLPLKVLIKKQKTHLTESYNIQ